MEAYSGILPDYLTIARNYSRPLFFGPPLCDELVELVTHMFTEEEATVARHIKSPLGKTARRVAGDAHLPVAEVRAILDRLADEKRIFFSFGKGEGKRYAFMPILPGVFEFSLVRTSMDSLTDWNRRFVELYEALFATGYFAEYGRYPTGLAQYGPLGNPHVLTPAHPGDRIAEVLDRYSTFGVGLCQCRMAEKIVGRGCGKMMDSCIAFGDLVESFIAQGVMRRIDKKEAIDIKMLAASQGLASFVSEVRVPGFSAGATGACCGCCCHALRTLNEFNLPGLIAPPQVVPQVNEARCILCGKCVTMCPVHARAIDAGTATVRFRQERCIGCGVCAVACGERNGITTVPSRRQRMLPENILGKSVLMGANYLRNAFAAWRHNRPQ